LTSLQIDLLTRNAILKCKDQFLFFPKDNIGVSLSREISKTIASIKASGVTYLQMRESYEGDDISLKNKIHDLSLVYETYENNSEKNGLDPNDMIEKFLQLSVFDEMSTQDVFVAGFDSFTSLGYKLIEKIILNASSFTIGTVGAMGQRNAFVYEEEMRIRIAGICKKNKIECSILQCDNDFNLNDRHICENFNVFKPQRIKNDEFIEVLECKDVKEEVGVVARKIKELIVEKNYRYNEINVALSNANEFNGTIKDVFEKFEIPFYLDEKISLKSTLLSKFILSFLTLFRFGFRMEDVKEFLLSPFVNIPMSLKHELFNHIDKYQREGSEIFKPLDFDYDGKEQLEQLIFDNLTILNKFKLISLKSMEINEFIAIINELINNFMIKDKIVQIAQEDNLGKNYVQEKINLQCEEKLKAVFDDLSVLGGEEVSLEDFYSFLDLALESKEISTVPLLVDCVYVGDATDSFFTPQKALFVLGANSDVLPKTNFDNGVISDRDIEAVADRAVLEPSIKMINFRNRFKLLNLLCLGENKLFVSFQSENSDGKARMPSQIVIDLRAMFFEKEGEILPICHGKKIAQLNALETKKACNEFAKTISCNFGAKEFLAGVSNEEPLLFEAAKEAILKILFKSTGYCLEKYLDVENERLDRATQLFFLDNRISATGLEKFNKCPFLFFCENGLGLKKESPMDFESIDIGSILHKCVELFCRENVGQLKTMEIADIAKISNNIFKKVILNGKYQYFLKKIEFKPIINLIKKELIRTCEKIVCEQKNSNYCVKHLEKHFGFDEENALSFQIGSQKIRLNGVIDRIDEFEEGFRVIDYKTGNVKNGLKNVYCGINLQLF
ncbi:MAG: PD-(D/E)XK nuclease family protein, partial [Clostridia bacterium]